MKGYKSNIEADTLDNSNFRKVVYTGKHMQLVLMSLKPGESIGEEIHAENDQFFRFEKGNGQCLIDNNEYQVKANDVLVVPAGARHNITNAGKEPLQFYTIYSPPHHKDAIVRISKEEAESNDEEFDGVTSELARA